MTTEQDWANYGKLYGRSGTDYRSGTIKGLGTPTEAGSTKWTSEMPGALFYSPTGSDWQEINESMLSDPAVAQAVMRGAAGSTAATPYFTELKGKIPAGVTQGIEGSVHSLSSDILNKMWR
jgi:hypothetical protein